MRQLFEGTFVFQFGEGATLQGVVVDLVGPPVVDAEVHVGLLDETGSRDARTEPDGSFRVTGCRPQTQRITASAGGYARRRLSA
jgi:hypothetical protein